MAPPERPAHRRVRSTVTGSQNRLLIVAELLFTLQLVIARGVIATEPFLFIGIIAVVRRVVSPRRPKSFRTTAAR